MRHIDFVAELALDLVRRGRLQEQLDSFAQVGACFADVLALARDIEFGTQCDEAAALSQWRGYCPMGKGVSVGFSPQKIIHAAAQGGYLLGRCIYDGEAKIKLAAEILDVLIKFSLSKGPSEESHPSNSFYHVFTDIEPDLLKIAALMKNTAFHEESEWRVVSEVVNNYVIAPIKYREGATMLVPYLEFPLCKSETGKLLIDHVFVGPTPEINRSIESIGRYLSRSGVRGVRVSNSQVPYRG